MVDYRGIDEKNVQNALDSVASEVAADVAVDVAAVQAEVDAVEVDVSSAEADIVSLQSDVGTAQTDISNLQADKQDKLGIFVSGVEVGTGAPQNVAHTLGVAPSKVLVSIQTSAGAVSIAEGVHTITDVVVTVTLGDTFKVLAIV